MPDFNFEENNVVEDLSSVPEKYHGLYVEGDGDNAGKRILSTAAKGIVGDYVGVSKSLLATRNDKKKVSDENAQRRLATKAFEELAESMGVEPGDDGYAAALKAHIEELTTKVKGGDAMKVNMDKLKQNYDKQLSEGLAGKDKEIESRDKALEKHLIENVALSALSKHKGSPELLMPILRNMCKVVRDEAGEYLVRVKDADGDARTNASGGFMGVAEVVEELKTQAAFKPAFESEAPAGFGLKPGSQSKTTIKPATSNTGEKSASQKIADGLAAGLHTSGVGRGRVA